MGSRYRINLDTQVAKLSNPLIIDDELPQALPSKSTSSSIPDLSEITHPAVAQVIKEFKTLFSQQAEKTSITHYIIDNDDALPAKVPPCPIHFHYNHQVWRQFTDMVKRGIIRPSSSP